MMQTRPVGRSGIHLSVVGFGTAQLQMVPEQQAVDTLVRGFDLGVNWVHTAPDYGGIDPWIQKAIEISGRTVHGPLRRPATHERSAGLFRAYVPRLQDRGAWHSTASPASKISSGIARTSGVPGA